MDFIPNVPVLTLVKLDPDEKLNYSHPLTGYNFEELFVVIGEFPRLPDNARHQQDTEGNGHYLLYRWIANGTNKPGMMPGQVELYRFKPVDPNGDLYITVEL